DPRKKEFECEVCGKILSGNQSLKKHKTTHQDDNDPEQAAEKRPFKCEKCEKTFRNAANLKNHWNTHTGNLFFTVIRKLFSSGEYPLHCNLCTRGYTSNWLLKKHMKNHLDDDDPRKKEFGCEICGKFLSTPATLRNHMQTHLAQGDPHRDECMCDICGKSLFDQHKQTHLVYFEGNYPFKCELRSLGVNTKRDLKRHMECHQKGTIKKYKREDTMKL
ncbi:hypothetical protein PENTCL1PPCAC_1835, partial [Pristionchus entomophagus]